MVIALALVYGRIARAVESVQAFVSIAPQAYLVERVGGPHVAVRVLVGPGQNHHTFEPTPRQLADLAGARVYFAIGLPFEKRLIEKIRAANPAMPIVDTREGVALRHMEEADAHDEAEAGHGAFDPHVWLSPLNAKILAANIAKGLRELDPPHAGDFDRNLETLSHDLDEVHARLAQTLAPFKGQALYVYHPAFGYFADAYGLRQASVEIEGKEPTARQITDLIDRAKRDRVRVIFVQAQFPKKSAEAIAKEIGGTVVAIDPLSRDYLANLEEIARKIAQSYRPGPE